jgi:hypothetical protein
MSDVLNLPRHGFTVAYKGRTVYVEVSPCSWMYAGNGLQARLALSEKAVNAESVFVNEKAIACRDANGPLSAAALRELAEAAAERWLAKNGVVPIEAQVATWAKDKAAFDAEFAKDAKREAELLTITKAIRKKHGFTHRTVAWIHPGRGDDYSVELWTKAEPTKAEIARLLRGSVRKDDYSVEAL